MILKQISGIQIATLQWSAAVCTAVTLIIVPMTLWPLGDKRKYIRHAYFHTSPHWDRKHLCPAADASVSICMADFETRSQSLRFSCTCSGTHIKQRSMQRPATLLIVLQITPHESYVYVCCPAPGCCCTRPPLPEAGTSLP